MDSFLMDYTEEDRKRAKMNGLLTAGLALLGAQKGREMEALSRAGLLGVAGYNQNLRDSADERRLNAGTRRQEQLMAMEAARMAEQQRYAQGMEQARVGALTPGMPEYGPPTQGGEMQPPIPQGFDLAKYAQGVTAVDPRVGIPLLQSLNKQPESPFDKPKPEHYTPQSLAAFARSRNPADLVRAVDGPKEQWEDVTPPPGADRGQRWQRDKVSGQLRAVGAVAPVTNVNVSSGPKPIWDAGSQQWLFPPASGPAGGAVSPEGFNPGGAKKAAQSSMALEVLKDADKLIDQATGSTGGYAVDQLVRVFGGATEGSIAIAKLKVLQANLMTNQPRMEGPQSDRDVELYREMAGKIGDPTTPNEEKAAALEEIRSLHRKYGGVYSRGGGGKIGGAPQITKLGNSNTTVRTLVERTLKRGDAKEVEELRRMGYIE